MLEPLRSNHSSAAVRRRPRPRAGTAPPPGGRSALTRPIPPGARRRHQCRPPLPVGGGAGSEQALHLCNSPLIPDRATRARRESMHPWAVGMHPWLTGGWRETTLLLIRRGDPSPLNPPSWTQLRSRGCSFFRRLCQSRKQRASTGELLVSKEGDSTQPQLLC